MIASLTGVLQHKSIDRVVVDVQGVGYQVHVSLQTLAELPAEGEVICLLCHTHVREDALQLYGFVEEAERRAFELLKGVSGVGPKLALTILSGMPVGQLTEALTCGDHRRLQNIPGIGKKTAERLVLELRDRVVKVTAAARPASPAGDSPRLGELVDALIGLGYKRPAAERAVQRVAEQQGDSPPEKLLRRALALLQEPAHG